ncbi:MAG TPA: hypothetical protein VF158_07885 [Longimicrobiales bacterium]
MLDFEGRALRAELVELLRRPIDEPLSDDAFTELARRVFAYQYARNEPYAAYCRRRGRQPDGIEHWSQIPAVPTAAFKEIPLVSGDPGRAEAVFRTSGTTRGRERRGEHYILDLTLYHDSLLPNFAAYLLPDGAEMPMLSLVPPVEQMVDSSLAHMIDVVVDRLGARGSRSFASVAAGIDYDALDDALRRYTAEGVPVLLLGTSFAFVHWTDHLRARGIAHRLPPGSRLMDTGGFKGRSREVPEPELRAAYRELLGIPEDHVVNEYGMTEMCSQFYDSVLRERVVRGAAGPRRKIPPPWVRTLPVDPETLEPVPPGAVGILRHHDLANLGSVAAVQTEDLGRLEGDGFVVLGRAAGAPPRGCSIAMDMLVRAAEERRR